MRDLSSADGVIEALQAYSSAAALNAALELGLPWLLEAEPRDHATIAASLGIPPGRCRWWLQVLMHLGVLEQAGVGFALTPAARRGILGSHHRESWAFLAREERERYPSLCDWTARLTDPSAAAGGESAGYFEQIAADPERASAFTRMLHDLHASLAEQMAGRLDLTGCRQLLDLGGGSGVMSLALVRRFPALSALVMDIPNVCAEGRRIAAEQGLEDRVSYVEGDLLSAPLPGGCDAVLECDVGVYQAGLFAAVRAALPPGGRFLVVDLMAQSDDDFPVGLLHWGFTGALNRPDGPRSTWARVRELLGDAGFRLEAEAELPEGYRLLEARA